nr:hypothetical protein [Candidatus Chloroploca sp. Khr17]
MFSRITIPPPSQLMPYIVEKGYIAVDEVSLTVMALCGPGARAGGPAPMRAGRPRSQQRTGGLWNAVLSIWRRTKLATKRCANRLSVTSNALPRPPVMTRRCEDLPRAHQAWQRGHSQREQRQRGNPRAD